MTYQYGNTPTTLTPTSGNWDNETWTLNTSLTTSTHVYYDATEGDPEHHNPARIAIDYSSGSTANAQVWETATGTTYNGSALTPYLNITSTGGSGDSTAVYSGPNGSPANMVTFNKVFMDVTSGPTVTSGRSSHSGIIPSASDFTIRDPNPGTWYEKTGEGKFKIKFYDQNEDFGGYNITINWTSLDNTSASHTETVSAASGDYYIEIDTLSNGVKHNSDITIKFNQNTYWQGTFYTAGNVLNTFTYLANGPFSGTITPSGGSNWSSIQISIQDDNPHPEGSRVVSYEKANGTQINVTLNESNSYSYTETYSGGVGTVKIYDTDKDNATSDNVIASANFAYPTGGYSGTPRDGYPIEITNLFHRNRSIYAIGMTHKTAGDPFI